MFRVAALLVPQCLIASKSVVDTDDDGNPPFFNDSEVYPPYFRFADDNPNNGDLSFECSDILFDDLPEDFDGLPAYTDGQIFDVNEAVRDLENTSPPTEPADKSRRSRKRKREESNILVPDAVFVDGIRITDGRKDANYRLAVAVLNSQYNDIDRLLINRKWRVNPNTYINPGKRTMLMIAASNNNKPVVELLLKRGADPLLKDDDGRTALDLTTDEAVKQLLVPVSRATDVAVRQLLSPSSATGSYAAAVSPVFRSGEISKANTQLALDVWGNKFEKVDALFKSCPHLNPNSYRDGEQKTLLMVAALKNNADMVKLLLERRANPLLIDSQSRTAFDLATDEHVKQLLSFSMMSYGSPIPVKRPRTQ